MTTIEIIKDLCKRENITIQALEMELGEKRTSIASANSNMKAEKLYKIASYFGVSMEYIMGKPDLMTSSDAATCHEPAAKKQLPLVTDDEWDLIERYRRFNDIGKAKITAYIDGMLDNAALLATPILRKGG